MEKRQHLCTPDKNVRVIKQSLFKSSYSIPYLFQVFDFFLHSKRCFQRNLLVIFLVDKKEEALRTYDKLLNRCHFGDV